MAEHIAGMTKGEALALAVALLGPELKRYEDTLDAAIKSQKGYLTSLEEGMYKNGKRLRPIMLLLSAGMTNPTPDDGLHDKVIQAAVSLEMLHVATLIHDDIIDRAPMRRGFPSVKAARGTEMAVLIGDLQFLQSIRGLLSSVVVQEDIAIIDKVLKAGYEICLGEIDELQMDPETAYDDFLELECRYMNIIDRKTAVLFSVSCESGAALVKGRTREILALNRFGRGFGQAFQIMDDLRDFSESAQTSGKQQNIDLTQKRLSLPIINALKALPKENALRHFLNRSESTMDEFNEAVSAVVNSDGFSETYAKARQVMVEAIGELDRFPESPHRTALEAIAYAVINT